MEMLLLVIVALALSVSALKAADTISVSGARGHVTYSESADGPEKPLVSNTQLGAGSRIRTAADSVAIIELPGGTKLKLLPKSDATIDASNPVFSTQPTASFVPVGSAIKSVLTHTDSEVHPDQEKPTASVSLKSGAVMASVENSDFRVQFAREIISTANASFVVTASPSGAVRISVDRGLVTLATPRAGRVEIPAGQFALVERQANGTLAVSGPAPGATNAAFERDLLALQGASGNLAPIAEYSPGDGKEVIGGKEVLPPVGELLPPAGLAADPGAVGTGLSNPFDLKADPNPRNVNRSNPVSPVNP